MRNLARNSKFDIRIDFEKSHDSFLYDKNTDRKYLDFFGMYASLPLGYNHKTDSIDSNLQIPTLYLSLELAAWYMHRRSLQIISCSDKEV